MNAPKIDPAKVIIKLELPAPVVQLTLQVLAAQRFDLVANAVKLISQQYDRQRKVRLKPQSKKHGG